MSGFIQVLQDHQTWLLRVLGALMGVLASLIMIAPEGTRNALYRVWVGVTMGVIFAPKLDDLWFLSWLQGETTEDIVARAALAAFCAWSILEFAARVLSRQEWLERLAREVLRIGNRGGEK